MRILLGLVLVTACGSDPHWEWPESTPEQQGMDSATLQGARTYAFQDGKHTQGVVVTRNGTLVAEWYEDGRDATSYGASWSMGKSFASATIGIALAEHKIDNVNVPLVNYYPQWQGSPRDQIQLEHVLHMATGLMWSENYQVDMANDSDVVQLLFTTDSPLDYVLAKPEESPTNTVFEYSSGDALLLSGIIQQATGKRAGDYAQEKLFSKLGITDAQWWRAKTGETLTYCCLDMTSRDYARFGLAFMQHGMFDGEQVIPAAWVDASITPSPLYKGYGYMWWLEGQTNPMLPPDTYAAEGHDGQFIYVIPSKGLVVVRNGHYDKFQGPKGPTIGEPSLFLRYPPDGLIEGGGTIPPDSWSDADFLLPIINSIRD